MASRASALGFAAALAAALTMAAGAPAPAAGPSVAERVRGCDGCHGRDGNSTTDRVPSLAAQPEIFLTFQMILFRERLRRSEQMTPQAAGLGDETILALAAHYARQTPRPAAAGPADREMMSRGRVLARAGRCGQCHLPDFSGRAQMPRLAGQREDYLAMVMREYRDDVRGGAETTMNDVMYGAGDADIMALAHYLSRQAPRPR